MMVEGYIAIAGLIALLIVWCVKPRGGHRWVEEHPNDIYMRKIYRQNIHLLAAAICESVDPAESESLTEVLHNNIELHRMYCN